MPLSLVIQNRKTLKASSIMNKNRSTMRKNISTHFTNAFEYIIEFLVNWPCVVHGFVDVSD